MTRSSPTWCSIIFRSRVPLSTVSRLPCAPHGGPTCRLGLCTTGRLVAVPAPTYPLRSCAHGLKSKQLLDSTLADFGMKARLGTPSRMAGIGRRRFGSIADSPMSFDTRGEYFPRVASYYSHGRSGSAASIMMRGSPPHTLVTIPEPVLAVEPVRARTGPLADRLGYDYLLSRILELRYLS